MCIHNKITNRENQRLHVLTYNMASSHVLNHREAQKSWFIFAESAEELLKLLLQCRYFAKLALGLLHLRSYWRWTATSDTPF